MAETKVTERDVMYVADLANLELTAEEKGRMIRDLNSILEHIDTLNELDTSDVPPLAEVASMFAGSQAADGGRFGYAMRPDEVRPGLPHEAAMANAPESDKVYFKVPKVIEK
ncbi:MAG: Asp-tRNA(Asn)/Glu-tRNA(Gln) amidotransferase subunit GatC [Candidatus Korobacteraceae bacterium]|jgi:aspartyl-tRNA(Asn)/glutamyl-tRNA(Gln) amidotransferase subunit C